MSFFQTYYQYTKVKTLRDRDAGTAFALKFETQNPKNLGKSVELNNAALLGTRS